MLTGRFLIDIKRRSTIKYLLVTVTEIEIEYCVPCGFRKHALEIQKNLLDRVEEAVDRIALKPGHGGVVIIRVDGEQVFHSGEDEYEPDELIDMVAERVEG